jgi:pimeloyl-ACP methyl ester carboxylesterase
MPTLNGTTARVPLGRDVTVQAAGFRGAVERIPLVADGTRAPRPAAVTPSLSQAFHEQDFTAVHAFTLDLIPVSGAPSTVRAPGGDNAVVLNLQATSSGVGQVAMLVDPSGVVTWHFPQPDPSAAGRAQIVLPITPVPPAGSAPADQRSIVGTVAHKLLTVLVYPIVKELVGAAAEKVAAYWEAKNRVANIRSFSTQTYRTPDPAPLDQDAWSALSTGRSLLFVHGTFSTSCGGFGGLPEDTMAEIQKRYAQRVFAYDHPTLSVTPEANVDALRQLAPSGPTIELDLVSHSRGGLVARAIASAGARGELPFAVRRIVYVATPNGGTVLADPKRLGTLINRYTTMLNLIPDGPWSPVADVMSGILTAVKVIGQGALGGLPGLQAMNPTDPGLARLGSGMPFAPDAFGISANFDVTGGLKLLTRAIDMTVDDVFSGQENDLVVPTGGVCDPPAGEGFPVPEANRLGFDATGGVWHCSYFSNPAVSEQLLAWLTVP